MAPIETTDAATADQRCPFKHLTWVETQSFKLKISVSPCAWVQANLLSISNCHPCAGAMLSSHSILQATRFVRVLLEQESMSSSQGEEEKTRICACCPWCKPYLCIIQKKPSQILTVILAQGPCNSVQREDKASGSSRQFVPPDQH